MNLIPATHLKKRKNTLRVEKQKTEKVSGNKKKQLEGHFPIGNGPVTSLGLKKNILKQQCFPKVKMGEPKKQK